MTKVDYISHFRTTSLQTYCPTSSNTRCIQCCTNALNFEYWETPSLTYDECTYCWVSIDGQQKSIPGTRAAPGLYCSERLKSSALPNPTPLELKHEGVHINGFIHTLRYQTEIKIWEKRCFNLMFAPGFQITSNLIRFCFPWLPKKLPNITSFCMPFNVFFILGFHSGLVDEVIDRTARLQNKLGNPRT